MTREFFFCYYVGRPFHNICIHRRFDIDQCLHTVVLVNPPVQLCQNLFGLFRNTDVIPDALLFPVICAKSILTSLTVLSALSALSVMPGLTGHLFIGGSGYLLHPRLNLVHPFIQLIQLFQNAGQEDHL